MNADVRKGATHQAEYGQSGRAPWVTSAWLIWQSSEPSRASESAHVESAESDAR